MFKRYMFGNGKWLLVNGYSITYYEEPLKQSMMARMEHTWYEGYRLSFDDRPAIPERHDSTGLTCKQTFYIDDIVRLSLLYSLGWTLADHASRLSRKSCHPSRLS